MYVLLNVQFFSYMTILITMCSRGTEGDATGLGDSSCDIVETYCNATTFWDEYPDFCSSFMFCCLSIDNNHKITFMYEGGHNEYLDKLGQSGKKLYIFFGRDNYTSWTEVLDCDGEYAKKEAHVIKTFTSEHKGITGLLLRNLEPAADDTIEIVGYTQMVLKYIEVVKQKTGLKIAFALHSDDFLAYYNAPKMSWLNFTVIDSCVDFYVFTLYSFRSECSSRSDGRIHITGDERNTLEKLKDAIKKSLIPNNKIYFEFGLGPDAPIETCLSNYQTMCLSPGIARNWCTETQETLFKQGQWFRENGAGFIGGYADLDDPDNVCKCGKYPAFNAVLAGFNGTDCVPTCPKFDRTG